MKKIAFIVQQYGLEMYGGAELHCMRLAEKMTSLYDVEVLTTCSIDYLTWANYYPEGKTLINGVTVRRFKVSQERSWKKMSDIEKRIRAEKPVLSTKKKIKLFFKKLFSPHKYQNATPEDYVNWIIAQGPTTPDLINYIKDHHHDYHCLIFFTYLYYPSVFGIEVKPEKSIFVPLAHDEWVIKLPIFKKMFNLPAAIMYNTLSEKRLVNKLFHNEKIHSEIAGTWVDIPPGLPQTDVKTTLNINSDYIIYVGRVDVNKITHDDFDMFLRYLRETKKNIKLVLVGNSYMKIPADDNILYLGFVDEQTKYNLIQQSLFLFQPSRFESLSHVVLEAFAMEKPVLVHADCEVMKDHIDISHGGYYYNDYEGFRHAINELSDNKSLNLKMGKSGKVYVDENYRWESIIGKFRDTIENHLKT